jgi:serine/threonine protein kinase
MNISKNGRNLIEKMLTKDPKKRPSAEECYNHTWFMKENKLNTSKLDLNTLDNFKSFHVKKYV